MFKDEIGKSPCFLNEKIKIVVKGKLTTNGRLSSNGQQGNKKNYFKLFCFFLILRFEIKKYKNISFNNVFNHTRVFFFARSSFELEARFLNQPLHSGYEATI